MIITPNRVQNLQWVDPTFPPRPKRNAIFSLIDYEGCLYFVNNSTETLSKVSSNIYGYIKDTATQNNPIKEKVWKK